MAPQTEAGQGPHAPAGLAAAASERRRITADSFRLLTARLKSKDPIPDLFETPAETRTLPEPVAETLAEVALAQAVERLEAPVPAAAVYHVPAQFDPSAGFALPDFVPLSEPASGKAHESVSEFSLKSETPPPAMADEQDIIAPQSAYVPAESGELVTPHDAAVAPATILQATAEFPAFPAFGEPLVPPPAEPEPLVLAGPEAVAAVEPVIADVVEPEPEPEPEPETTAIAFEALPDPAETSIEEPAADTAEFASDEPGTTVAGDQPAEQSLASVIGAAKPVRATSPLAEKVVDALIKTVTEAVYAKPSASERAAFLREIAELVERGEAEAPESALVPDVVNEAPTEILEEAVEAAPPGSAGEPLEIKEAIADRLGPASQILRKSKEQDPFAVTARPTFDVRRVEETPEADEDSGDLAISLLDMMSGGSASSQPQERALAADTLLRMVARIPSKQLLAIAERVSIMESPPSLLVAKLIRDHRHEIAAPLLERCMHITDQDLATATAEGDVYKLRMIAKRRLISPTLSDQLIDRGDTSVILTLVRNPGVSLNHDSFFRLADHAIEHHAVLAPLATRADLPAPVAFELFWHVPQELRRFILSRFLTDSENLNRILKITKATQAPADGSAAAEPKFPPQELLEAALQLVASGELERGAQQLADVAGTALETVLRILADREGEPVAVLLKTLGFQRSKFSETVANLQQAEISLVRSDRKVEELQNIFDTLSFNKARILLTYWDWYVRKAGPYAPHN